MTQAIRNMPLGDLDRAASAVLARYTSASAHETEAAIGLLALWALDAIEAGRIAPNDADSVFTRLDVALDEAPAGPELSDDLQQLLLEAMTFHDWGTEFSADPARLRELAFAILGRRA